MLNEYTRVNWQDADSTATPINAENLNNMDAQIEAATNAIRSLEETGVSPEAIIAAVNDYLDEHHDSIYDVIDDTFSETSSSTFPRLTTETYQNDVWLTYVDSEEVSHHLVNLSQCLQPQT